MTIPARFPLIPTTPALAASTQQNQIAGHDFSHIFLLPRSLVVPRTRLQAALDVNLATLLQILPGNLRQALPQHYVVPLRAVLPLAGFIFEALVGGDRQLATGVPCGVYLISGSFPRFPIS